MKKVLIAFCMLSIFGLVACSDGFLLKDPSRNAKQFDLSSAYTGPGKDYKPMVDPNKKFSLYKVNYVYKMENGSPKRSCNTMQFIEDQLDRKECLNLKKVNIDRDEASSQNDGIKLTKDSQEPQVQKRIYDEGPLKGREAWEYWCLTEKGIESWASHSCN